MNAVTALLPSTPTTVPKPTHQADVALIQRIKGGDTTAFESLYLELHPRLFRFLVRLIGAPDQAEDLLNETMLVVWERPGGYDGSCKLSTWIFGIAYRKALKTAAKASQFRSSLPVEELSEVLADRNAPGTRQVDLDDWLAVALAGLPSEQKAVIELTYYHGLPYQEIARILDCPENTVKTRMFNARRKLQPMLRDLLPDLADYRSEDAP